MKLLLIEDELELARDMASYLCGLGYVCEMAATQREAVHKISSHDYDCILLDLMLPDGDGLRLLGMLRDSGKQDGLVIISAKNSLEDKVRGLEIGADDYLAKPFHLSELSARVLSVIRRRQFSQSNVFTQNGLTVDLSGRSVRHGEVLVPLTKKEFDLLVYFMGNKNKVVSKGALAEHLTGDLADMLDDHGFVYAHVKNLKRKLSDSGCAPQLKTVYGSGYKWEVK